MRRVFFVLACILMAACSQHKAPLVGITNSHPSSGATHLASAYTEAIGKAGAVPLVIPTVTTREEADAILARLDGIVFSGGKDVSPSMYGEDILNETVSVDPVRDFSDSLLAVSAIESGKPVLAICRGAQLVNVVLGGTLYQDLSSQLPGNIGHGGGAIHKIGLENGSVLARVYGRDSIEVNSYHHQAVKDPAPGIRITARAADGIIESYETDRILAVQFHPEKSVQEGDDGWLRLFEAFVSGL